MDLKKKKTAEAPPLTSLIHQPYEVQSKVPENEGRGTEETCNTEPTQDESEIRERLNPTPSPTKLSPKRVWTTRSGRVGRDPARFKDFTT